MASKNSFEITGIDKVEKLLDGIKDPINRSDGLELGNIVVSEMKNLIAKGISPIKGMGRFPGYKNPDKYPGDLKSKRPVNLYGFSKNHMLDSLKVKSSRKGNNGCEVIIGYADEESNLKEQGHREGVKGQPKRPTIPTGSEEIAVSIERKIIDYIKNILRSMSNK